MQKKRQRSPPLIMPARFPFEQIAQLAYLLNVADGYVTSLQRQVYFAEVAKYICQVCEHHNKLFIAKLDMEISFVFFKKNFNLVFQFIQMIKASASRQLRDYSIKEKSHMLCSHFFGQKLEEPVIFCSRRIEVDHFDSNVHNFYQTRR